MREVCLMAPFLFVCLFGGQGFSSGIQCQYDTSTFSDSLFLTDRKAQLRDTVVAHSPSENGVKIQIQGIDTLGH